MGSDRFEREGDGSAGPEPIDPERAASPQEPPARAARLRSWAVGIALGVGFAVLLAAALNELGLPGPSGTPLRRYPADELHQAERKLGEVTSPLGSDWPVEGDSDPCHGAEGALRNPRVDLLRSRVVLDVVGGVGGNGYEKAAYEDELRAALAELGVPREMVALRNPDYFLICSVD